MVSETEDPPLDGAFGTSTASADIETQVSDETAVIETEAPPLDEEFGTSTESADAVVISADVHELRFEVPSDFTGIDVVTVNVSAGGENLSVGLGVSDVLSGLGEDDTASSLFANAFVSAFESEFPEASDISSEVVTEIEGGSSTVVLSATSGPIILSVLAESREEQLVTEGVEVSAYTLTGSDGADDVIEVQSEIGFVLEGASGADTLIGGSGADTLIGGGGDDVFVVDGGEDVIDGGAGRDALDFSASVAGVQVDLSAGTLVDGEGFEDQFSSIEIVTGSDAVDTLVGSDGDDTLLGGGGADTLIGGGEDVFVVDGGEDVMMAARAGTLWTSLPQSLVCRWICRRERWLMVKFGDQFSSIEIVAGSDAADTLVGSEDTDTFIGGGGNDTLIGGGGDDVFVVDGGEDVIDGGAGTLWTSLPQSLVCRWICRRERWLMVKALGISSVRSRSLQGPTLRIRWLAVKIPTRLLAVAVMTR